MISFSVSLDSIHNGTCVDTICFPPSLNIITFRDVLAEARKHFQLSNNNIWVHNQQRFCTLKPVQHGELGAIRESGIKSGDTLLSFDDGSLKLLDFINTRDMPVEDMLLMELNEFHARTGVHLVELPESFALSEENNPLKSISVFLETVHGKAIEFKCDLSDTVYKLKTKFQNKEGIPPDQTRFIFAGEVMQDGRTLSDYRIGNHSTIFLELRCRGGMLHPSSARNDFETLSEQQDECNITLKILFPNGKLEDLEVNCYKTVAFLKKQIASVATATKNCNTDDEHGELNEIDSRIKRLREELSMAEIEKEHVIRRRQN